MGEVEGEEPVLGRRVARVTAGCDRHHVLRGDVEHALLLRIRQAAPEPLAVGRGADPQSAAVRLVDQFANLRLVEPHAVELRERALVDRPTPLVGVRHVHPDHPGRRVLPQAVRPAELPLHQPAVVGAVPVHDLAAFAAAGELADVVDHGVAVGREERRVPGAGVLRQHAGLAVGRVVSGDPRLLRALRRVRPALPHDPRPAAGQLLDLAALFVGGRRESCSGDHEAHGSEHQTARNPEGAHRHVLAAVEGGQSLT